jgi:hypothetical protein
MFKTYEYLVCNVQLTRVTWVNGAWQGQMPPTPSNQNEALLTCPHVWDYLADKGTQGWQLVSTAIHNLDNGVMEVLYLQRERYNISRS